MSRSSHNRRFKSAVFNTKMNAEEARLNRQLIFQAREYKKNQEETVPSMRTEGGGAEESPNSP